MKPMTLLGVAAVFFILIIAFYPFLRNAAGTVLPASKDSVNGEWVGTLSITAIGDRYGHLTPFVRSAAIRLNVRPKGIMDTLGDFAGKGELTIAGEPHAFTVDSPDIPYNSGGRLDDCMLSITDESDKRFPVFFTGTLTSDRFEIHSNDKHGLQLYGTLRKGSDREYQHFVDELSH